MQLKFWAELRGYIQMMQGIMNRSSGTSAGEEPDPVELDAAIHWRMDIETRLKLLELHVERLLAEKAVRRRGLEDAGDSGEGIVGSS